MQMSVPFSDNVRNGNRAPAAEPLLVDKPWQRVGISRATWGRLTQAGKTPANVPLPVRKKLYRPRDLELWVEWGCPARNEFEARIAMNQRLGRPPP
jgi:hypothetical protein